MSKGKLAKFAEVATLPNVVQNFSYDNPALQNSAGEQVDLKGEWSKRFFENEQPLVLELACGKGDYTVALAQMYPDKNFLGIDIKGNRIWRGAKTAHEEKITNAGFLRTRIELLPHFFEKDEVSEIWITFPDPFARKGSENRRLTSPALLETYKKVCRKGAIIHLKTDADSLYEYSLEIMQKYQYEVLESDNDIYRNGDREGVLGIKTYYEKMHLKNSKKIKYLKFVLH